MPNTLMDMFQPHSLADNQPIGFGDALAQNRQSLIGLGMGLLTPRSMAVGAPAQSAWSNALGGYEQGAAQDARQANVQAQLAHQKRQEAFQRSQAAQAQSNWEKQFGREPEVLRTMRASGIDPTSPEGRALLYPKTDEWKAGSVTVREKEYPYRANLRTGQYEWGPLGPPPGVGAPAVPAVPYAGGAAVPFVGGGGTPSAAGVLPSVAPSTTGAGGAATTTPSGAIPPPLPGMEDELPSVQKDIRKKQLEDYSKTQLKDPQQQAAAQKSAADVLTAIDTAEKQALNKGGLLPTTGILGGKLTQVYQPSADLSASLNTIAANISLDKLNAMRQASTSGASGLGAVTEPEHRMLMNSIAALEQSQSQDQLLANLKRVRATYNWIVNRTDKNEPPPFSLRPDASQPTTTGGGAGGAGAGGRTFIRDPSGRIVPQMIVNFEGQQHNFPDDATDTEISAALAALPKAPRAADAPMTAEGAYKALDVGVQEGVAGLASLPRTIGTLGAQGIQGAANWVSRKLGLPEDTRDLEKQKGVVELPTYESALGTIQDSEGMWGGQPYTPQNTGEEYLRTLGQFAPNVAFGGGGLVRGVVAPALASETAGQLTKGYGAEPYARMAGAVLGGGLASTAADIKRTGARGYRGAPVLEDVGPAVDRGYTALRSADVELNPSYISQGLDRIGTDLISGPNARAPRLIGNTLGLIGDEAKALAPAAAPVPGAMAALTKVAPAAPAARPPVDFTRLDALRRDLGEIARDFTNPTEQAAARIAQTKIDDLLEAAGRTPGAVLKGDANLLAQTAREARGNAAAEFRMRALEAVKQRAEDQAGAAHSGRNVENAYRQQLKAFVRPDNKGISPAQRAGLSRDEITEIRQATRGTSFPNLLRTFGNILGGGGGIATGGLGAAGYLSGDPRFYAAAGLGFGARNLSNALMRSRANYLGRMVGARSPLGQQTGFTQPGPMTDATRPSLLSLIQAYQGGGP